MAAAIPFDPTSMHPSRTSSPLPTRDRVVEAVLGLLVVLATAGLALKHPGMVAPDPLTAVLLIVGGAVCCRVRFFVGSLSTTPIQLVLVAMLVLVPAPLVPVYVAAAMLLGRLGEFAGGRCHPDRLLLVLPDAAYAIAPAAVLTFAGYEVSAAGSEVPLDTFVLALLAQCVGQSIFSLVRERLVGLDDALSLREELAVSATDVALAPIGLLAALSAHEHPLVLLAVLPLVALLREFAREREDRIKQASELAAAYRGTALLMSDVLEADDAYTGGEHTRGVLDLAQNVGERLGLDATAQRDLEFGALLHDIGKIYVPDAIINKPGKLTPEEWEIIKRHPEDGQRMLERVGGVLSGVGVIVRGHHESWDGRGYPDALAGEDIPLASRIIAVCDAFSAMTTDRSYRKAMPVRDAAAELVRCAGSQFDPRVVAELVALVGPTAFVAASVETEPADAELLPISA